jgi:hypothetical protein
MEWGSGCVGWSEVAERPLGVVCPPRLEYPAPPSPVRLLFVSWNPPGPTHFWNSQGDRLRRHLSWVLGELGWPTQPDFLGEFLQRGAFLVHAVKCWQQRDWPSPDAIARCARASFLFDLLQLRPERLCLLGRVPFEVASKVVQGLPVVMPSYFEGWTGDVSVPSEAGTRHLPTLVTVLPSHFNRKHTLAALRSWLPPGEGSS